MTRFFLNVGLWHRNTRNEMLTSRPLAALEACGLRFERMCIVRKPDEEPSLVLFGRTVLDTADFDSVLFRACAMLDQDCIARWIGGAADSPHSADGALVGPRAAEWGEFDTSKFYFL